MNDTSVTSSDHSQSSFSFLLSLPCEIIEIILNLVLHDLILCMKTRQRPRFIISQYRTLLLICKPFKILIDQAKPRLHMNFTVKYQQIGEHKGYYPNIHFITDENIHEMEKDQLFKERYFRQWSIIFKVYQKICIRNADRIYHGAHTHLVAIGKFWLNDRVSLGDFRSTVHDHPEENLDLLLILARPIQRRACPIERPCGDVATLPGLEWYLHRNTTTMRLMIDIDRVINYVGTG
jgi:hypothetical protein